MESEQLFQNLIDQLCHYLDTPQQNLSTCKRQRTYSVCQTPVKSKRKMVSTAKSLKNFKHLNLAKRLSEMKKNNSTLDEQQSKYFVSEKKQKINEVCVLCGIKPCNYRLACAHAIHEECFNKSPFVPLCKICQSKNISIFEGQQLPK